jgi:predicted signal transduction protein with EAL and GGDEF domain
VNGGLSPGALLKQADLALYRSKEAGRNTVRLYQPEMQVRAASRSVYEAQLPAALPNEERDPDDQSEVDGPGRIIG